MGDNKKIIDVDYIAELARLEIDEEKKEIFQKDMENIVKYVDQLSELNVDDVIPTAHALNMDNVWREDKEGKPFMRNTMLANAPETIGDELIKVPQVLPGEGTA